MAKVEETLAIYETGDGVLLFGSEAALASFDAEAGILSKPISRSHMARIAGHAGTAGGKLAAESGRWLKLTTESAMDVEVAGGVARVASGVLRDFGELDERRVTLSEDGQSVTVELPAPVADKPVLDLENSYVADRDEGVVNRFSGSELEREAQLQAVEQMTTAAAAEGKLIDLAKENTTAMLRGLFGSLGFTDITITFDGETT